MIRINLLPEEERRKKAFVITQAHLISLGASLLTILLFISVVMAGLVWIRGRGLNYLTEKSNSLKPQSERILEIKKEKEGLESKMRIVRELTEERILWAKKLYEISRDLPDQVWLTSLSLDKSSHTEGVETVRYSVLFIKGNVFSTREEHTELVTRFMKNLQEDEDFFEDFVDVERGPIKRIDGTDVMSFELDYKFEPGI